MKCLAINSWFKFFEPAVVKDATVTVSLPTKRGMGMIKLSQHPEGAAAYGVFVTLLSLAVTSVPRGTLTWTDQGGLKAHDAQSLNQIIGFSTETIQRAIDILLGIGWLEYVEFEITATPKKPAPPIEDFLKEMGAKLTHNGESMLGEWDKALKGMKPSDARRVFKDAVPGISFPREFLNRRKEMGL